MSDLAMTDEERAEIHAILYDAVHRAHPIYDCPDPSDVIQALRDKGFIITTWRVAIAAQVANA